MFSSSFIIYLIKLSIPSHTNSLYTWRILSYHSPLISKGVGELVWSTFAGHMTWSSLQHKAWLWFTTIKHHILHQQSLLPNTPKSYTHNMRPISRKVYGWRICILVVSFSWNHMVGIVALDALNLMFGIVSIYFNHIHVFAYVDHENSFVCCVTCFIIIISLCLFGYYENLW